MRETITVKDGVYPHMPMEDYLKADAINSSSIKLFHKSEQHLKDHLDGLLTEEATDPMIFGGLLHSAFFEKKFDFVVQPEKYLKRTKKCPGCGSLSDSNRCSACKMDRNDFNEERDWSNAATTCVEWNKSQKLPILTKEEKELLERCLTALEKCPLILPLLGFGSPEVSMFATDPVTGLQIKCRADWLCKPSIVDLKSCLDASTDAFRKEILKRKYHLQAAMNMKVSKILDLGVDAFYFIALEKGEVPRVNVGPLDPLSLKVGLDLINDTLPRIAKCLRTGKWAGYVGSEMNEFRLPDWAFEDDGKLNMDE